MLQPDTLMQGRFRIIRQIGKGGMGTVYLARDENLGVTVAVKQNFFDDERLIEAFKRESRLLAGLRHSALPQVKDYFINDTGQYLVMEYIAGADFGTLLEKRQQKIEPVGAAKPFEVNEVVQWAEQLLDALDYLHTRPEPVIHRDIKPQNLKLAERNQIILLDFGLAKGKPQWMTQVTTTGSLYGYTPNYAPIEQIQGAGTDPRSDLYALGATLYHLLTGAPPVGASTRADAFIGGEPDPLRPVNEVNLKVPHEIAAVLTRAMEQHRNKRPATAAEMLEMLRAAKQSIVLQVADSWPTTEIKTHKRLGEEQKRRGGAEQQRQQEEEARQAREEAVAQQAQREQEEREWREQEEREWRAAEEAKALRQEQARAAREEAKRLKQQKEREQHANQELLVHPLAPPMPEQQEERKPRPANDTKPLRKKGLLNQAISLALIGLLSLVVIIVSKTSDPQTATKTNAPSESAPSTSPQAGTGTSALKELANSFVRITAGEFMMGSENPYNGNERPVHRVRISRGFEIGKYEVTQGQWAAVLGTNPSKFQGAYLPVEQVSWDDVQQFIQNLNAQNDGYVYRLPTEAEWEYACRAGSTGDYAGNLDAMAWYEANSGEKTHPVGQKQPNAWGLYDMYGNVWEWCSDWYSENYYSQSPSADPRGPSTGSARVYRGGSWYDSGKLFVWSASRNWYAPSRYRLSYHGFRLVRTHR